MILWFMGSIYGIDPNDVSPPKAAILCDWRILQVLIIGPFLFRLTHRTDGWNKSQFFVICKKKNKWEKKFQNWKLKLAWKKSDILFLNKHFLTSDLPQPSLNTE